MKNWIIMLIAFLGVSCFDDKGNYTYKNLDKVVVNGIQTDEWYEKFAYADSLIIPVTLESELYKNGEEPFAYEWKLIPIGADKENADTITNYTVSREKNLRIDLKFKAGEYCGFFLVKDTILGVVDKIDFFVRIRTTTSDGWMVLCEQNGNARLDMVVNQTDDEDIISRDIWSGNSFQTGKPYKLLFDFMTWGCNRFCVCEKSTYQMDADDLHIGEGNDLRWSFGDLSDGVRVLGSDVNLGRDYSLCMLVTDTKDLYVRSVYLAGALFDYPINYTSDGKRFDVSPYFGNTYKTYSWNVSIILYDETNLRFMELRDDEIPIPQPLRLTQESKFSAETGRKMVYMNWTTDNYTFALLEDPKDNEMYIYGILVQDEGKNTGNYYMKLNRPNQDKIVKVAFHSLYRYMFYLTDQGDVYQFDMTTPETPAQKILSFPGEKVTVMKINKMLGWIKYTPWQLARGDQLIVGSNLEGEDENECGIMRVYEVTELMKPLKLKKEFKKLGKIVDITYREQGK